MIKERNTCISNSSDTRTCQLYLGLHLDSIRSHHSHDLDGIRNNGARILIHLNIESATLALARVRIPYLENSCDIGYTTFCREKH